MISKHIFLIAFLNEHAQYTVELFHLFLSDTNNSIYSQSFVCTQFNVFKYCYLTLTIQLIHSLHIRAQSTGAVEYTDWISAEG